MKIIVNNKEYDSGKITRSKYKLYREAFEKLESKEFYSEEDLDTMVDTIVRIYDKQFTEDDINDDFEVSDIIYNFMSINIDIGEKLNKKIAKVQKTFQPGKK